MGYGTITTERAGGVLTATIKNGPVNICDWKFLFDLNELLDSCKADSGIKILVFQSANSDFFLAHLDLLPRPGKASLSRSLNSSLT
jgi:enoyl-CoA hydratase/carnithine racemase